MLLLLALMVQLCNAQTPTWQWARHEDEHEPYHTFKAGAIERTYGRLVLTDEQGNVYVLGSMTSPYFTFGKTTLSNVNGKSFLVKYNAAGKVLWAFNAGIGKAQSAALDGKGNIYFSGEYDGAQLALGNFTLTNTQPGSNDAYIAKCDSTGNVLWAQNAGGYGNEYSYGLSADVSGNVYFTGIFSGPQITLGGVTIKNYVPVDFRNVNETFNGFLFKIDGTGKVLWAKTVGGRGISYSTSVRGTADGGVCITGFFSCPVINFDNIRLSNSPAKGVRLSNFYIAKFDAQGNAQWAHGNQEEEANLGNRVTSDAAGNLFVIGSFAGKTLHIGSTALTNPGAPGNALFVARYDATGTFKWAQATGGFDQNTDRLDICADAAGNCYIAGGLYKQVTQGNYNLTNTSAAIIKFDPTGNVTWANGLVSNAETSAVAGSANGIALDTKGNVFVTGEVLGKNLVFGNIVLPNGKADRKCTDFFLAKLK